MGGLNDEYSSDWKARERAKHASRLRATRQRPSGPLNRWGEANVATPGGSGLPVRPQRVKQAWDERRAQRIEKTADQLDVIVQINDGGYLIRRATYRRLARLARQDDSLLIQAIPTGGTPERPQFYWLDPFDTDRLLRQAYRTEARR